MLSAPPTKWDIYKVCRLVVCLRGFDEISLTRRVAKVTTSNLQKRAFKQQKRLVTHSVVYQKRYCVRKK